MLSFLLPKNPNNILPKCADIFISFPFLVDWQSDLFLGGGALPCVSSSVRKGFIIPTL